MGFVYAGYLLFVLLGAFLILFFFCTPLSFKKKHAIVRALMISAIVFSWWDVWAVARGHWSFNPAFTLGVWIGNQPLEEILFFIIIPFFGIAVWEALAKEKSA